MAKKKTDESKPKVKVIMHGLRELSAAELGKHVFMAPPPRPAPRTPTAPPLNSPEFDQLAKSWLEELIRRAQAAARPACATGASVPLTIRARGEGPHAFDGLLTNLYDLRTDPLGLMAGLKEVSRDALEGAIREAGFGGWFAPAGPGMKGPISAVFNLAESVRVAVPPGPNGDEVIH